MLSLWLPLWLCSLHCLCINAYRDGDQHQVDFDYRSLLSAKRDDGYGYFDDYAADGYFEGYAEDYAGDDYAADDYFEDYADDYDDEYYHYAALNDYQLLRMLENVRAQLAEDRLLAMEMEMGGGNGGSKRKKMKPQKEQKKTAKQLAQEEAEREAELASKKKKKKGNFKKPNNRNHNQVQFNGNGNQMQITDSRSGSAQGISAMSIASSNSVKSQAHKPAVKPLTRKQEEIKKKQMAEALAKSIEQENRDPNENIDHRTTTMTKAIRSHFIDKLLPDFTTGSYSDGDEESKSKLVSNKKTINKSGRTLESGQLRLDLQRFTGYHQDGYRYAILAVQVKPPNGGRSDSNTVASLGVPIGVTVGNEVIKEALRRLLAPDRDPNKPRDATPDNTVHDLWQAKLVYVPSYEGRKLPGEKRWVDDRIVVDDEPTQWVLRIFNPHLN